MSQPNNKDDQGFHLILVAAGSGIRMGGKTPKQFQKIAGQTVLDYSLNKFIKNNNLKSFVKVVSAEYLEQHETSEDVQKQNEYTIGGKTRKQSVCNGLKRLVNVKNEDIILVHDAARPLIHAEDIHNILDVMQNNNAATLATPVKDTLYRAEQNIDRDGLWAIQTPQAFKYADFIAAHEELKDDDSFTDDAGIMRACGHHVEIVPANHPNIKITTPDDFAMVKAMIEQTLETRTASGFDVHAFESAPSTRKLMLGGIEIPHDVALTGHSDADVVLHAITDALLGAINDGDIGTHFPPTDPQWKDAESGQFLVHAHDLLKNKGGTLKFVDVTIMAEAPKIGPHRNAIQNSIAQILSIPTSRISIKATTTEKLGFTGRKEGMAAQALVTITLPTEDE